MKISVVTTFHSAGYKKYGKRMIETFLKNWPETITLYVYAEDVNVEEKAPNLKILDLHRSSSELVAFKLKWKDVPKANGDISKDPIRSKRKDSGKGFKWNAIRFAHKVYSIFHCAKICDSDILLWMDADTVCHSPITQLTVESFCPMDKDIGYLGRKDKYSECGLYYINLKSNKGLDFLKQFQHVYDEAENGIFKMAEWHDSYVFDQVRLPMKLKEINWSEHLHDLRPSPGMSKGEGHPLINSEWGAYLDHLKGGRKDKGRSDLKDLKVKRKESYWNS